MMVAGGVVNNRKSKLSRKAFYGKDKNSFKNASLNPDLTGKEGLSEIETRQPEDSWNPFVYPRLKC